jgi:hypothetical protein
VASRVRKWWNWQTHHLEGVAPKGVGVQIPPSAPDFQTTHPLNFRVLPFQNLSLMIVFMLIIYIDSERSIDIIN